MTADTARSRPKARLVALVVSSMRGKTSCRPNETERGEGSQPVKPCSRIGFQLHLALLGYSRSRRFPARCIRSVEACESERVVQRDGEVWALAMYKEVLAQPQELAVRIAVFPPVVAGGLPGP